MLVSLTSFHAGVLAGVWGEVPLLTVLRMTVGVVFVLVGGDVTGLFDLLRRAILTSLRSRCV